MISKISTYAREQQAVPLHKLQTRKHGQQAIKKITQILSHSNSRNSKDVIRLRDTVLWIILIL